MNETLHLEKIESTDFKYDNGFFKFQPENTKINKFCPIFKYFYFCMKFAYSIIQGLLISKMAKVFPNSSLKIPKCDIFCEKSEVFSGYVKLSVNLILLNRT